MLLSIWWRRLWLFIRRDRARRELEDEMQLHRELRARAMERSGLTPADAVAQTRRRFGNASMVVERSQATWGFQRSDELRWNIRYALRRLIRRPAFSSAILVVMGLGIGATTAMFSMVDAVVLRSLPFREPSQLVTLPSIDIPFADSPGTTPAEKPFLSLPAVAGMTDLFASTAAFAAGHLNLRDATRPTRLRVGVVTTGFFRTLGIDAAAGRTFSATDGVPGAPLAIVLSNGFWQRQYGAQPMLGKTVTLDDQQYQVVGIMPRGFSFPEQSDVWVPMSVPNTIATLAAFHGYVPARVIARLAFGVQITTANRRILERWQLAMNGLTAGDGPTTRDFREQFMAQLKSGGAVRPLHASLAGENTRPLVLLLGATALLLFIACANVTNLLLADAAARDREMALRSALGASRSRILRQVLAESVILALGGLAVGIVVAPVSLSLLRALMPDALAGLSAPGLDWRVLGFASTLSVITGVGFGLWPARNAARSAPADTLKSSDRLAGSRRSAQGIRVLITLELALTVMLVIGSGLLLKSFARVMDVDVGMTTARIGSVELAFASSATSTVRRQRIDAILERLRQTPGIVSAAAVNDLPLSGATGSMSVLARSVSDAATAPAKRGARYLQVSADYFATLGIPLQRGRDFLASDSAETTPNAIVNQALARRWFPDVDPIGRQIAAMGRSTPYTIVGVVADVRELGLESQVTAQIYHPISRVTPSSLAIVARGIAGPQAVLGSIRAAVRAVDPTQALGRSRMMDDVLSESVAPRRTNALLISVFAGLALVLASVGVYSVVAQGIAYRTREFGIRTALGATAGNLIAMISREILVLVALGLGIGLAGAWTAARVLTAMVYGVTVHDPTTFVVAATLLAITAMIAALLPLRHVARVSPHNVLRSD